MLLVTISTSVSAYNPSSVLAPGTSAPSTASATARSPSTSTSTGTSSPPPPPLSPRPWTRGPTAPPTSPTTGGSGRDLQPPTGPLTPPLTPFLIRSTRGKLVVVASLPFTIVSISSHSRHGRSVDQVDNASSKSGEPWYREVAELRKQANEFRVSDDVHLAKLTVSLHNKTHVAVPRLGDRSRPSAHQRSLPEADGRAVRAGEEEGVAVGVVAGDITEVRSQMKCKGGGTRELIDRFQPFQTPLPARSSFHLVQSRRQGERLRVGAADPAEEAAAAAPSAAAPHAARRKRPSWDRAAHRHLAQGASQGASASRRRQEQEQAAE